MKKTLFLCVSLLFLNSLSAQEDTDYGISKGDIFLSGTMSYINEKQGNQERSIFSFSPAVEFFVSDHWALNGGLLFNTGKVETEPPTPSTLDQNALGLQLGTSYFVTPENQFSFLFSLNGSYQRYRQKFSNDVDELKSEQWSFTFAPGINYFVSDNFALRASLGVLSYFTADRIDAPSDSFNRFDFNLNLSNVAISAILRL